MQELMFISSRIDDLIYRVTFDPLKKTGRIIINISVFDSEKLNDVLEIFKRSYHSGLAVSPYIKIIKSGEKIDNMVVEKGKACIATACSLTIDGVLLKAGIPIKPKFGGVVEIEKGVPIRFTDILTYRGTTIDPLEIFMSQDLASENRFIETGSGKILANLREAPMAARDVIEQVLEALVNAGFSGILEVGEPNMNILGISVDRDHLGIAVIGGTNPMAAMQENDIDISTYELASVMDIEEMEHIDKIPV